MDKAQRREPTIDPHSPKSKSDSGHDNWETEMGTQDSPKSKPESSHNNRETEMDTQGRIQEAIQNDVELALRTLNLSSEELLSHEKPLKLLSEAYHKRLLEAKKLRDEDGKRSVNQPEIDTELHTQINNSNTVLKLWIQSILDQDEFDQYEEQRPNKVGSASRRLNRMARQEALESNIDLFPLVVMKELLKLRGTDELFHRANSICQKAKTSTLIKIIWLLSNFRQDDDTRDLEYIITKHLANRISNEIYLLHSKTKELKRAILACTHLNSCRNLIRAYCFLDNKYNWRDAIIIMWKLHDLDERDRAIFIEERNQWQEPIYKPDVYPQIERLIVELIAKKRNPDHIMRALRICHLSNSTLLVDTLCKIEKNRKGVEHYAVPISAALIIEVIELISIKDKLLAERSREMWTNEYIRWWYSDIETKLSQVLASEWSNEELCTWIEKCVYAKSQLALFRELVNRKPKDWVKYPWETIMNQRNAILWKQLSSDWSSWQQAENEASLRMLKNIDEIIISWIDSNWNCWTIIEYAGISTESETLTRLTVILLAKNPTSNEILTFYEKILSLKLEKTETLEYIRDLIISWITTNWDIDTVCLFANLLNNPELTLEILKIGLSSRLFNKHQLKKILLTWKETIFRKRRTENDKFGLSYKKLEIAIVQAMRWRDCVSIAGDLANYMEFTETKREVEEIASIYKNLGIIKTFKIRIIDKWLKKISDLYRLKKQRLLYHWRRF